MISAPGTKSGMGKTRIFEFKFDPLYRAAGVLFGITPGTTLVRVTDWNFTVIFGPWRLTTARSNIRSTAVTGPYKTLKTIGPPHLSLANRGLTCATNAQQGLCVQFAEPVPGIEPTGLLRHPGVTVTVADCAGLAAALA